MANRIAQGEKALNLIGLLVEYAAEDEAIVDAIAGAGLSEIYLAMVELYDDAMEDMLAEPPPVANHEEVPPEAGE